MLLPEEIRSAVEASHAKISLLVRSGSKAYGIEVEGSDDDYVGIFVPRLQDLVSIYGIKRDTIRLAAAHEEGEELGAGGFLPGAAFRRRLGLEPHGADGFGGGRGRD